MTRGTLLSRFPVCLLKSFFSRKHPVLTLENSKGKSPSCRMGKVQGSRRNPAQRFRWESSEKVCSAHKKSLKEPLNNSLCPVPARYIGRYLHLVKVISAQNSHYFSAFLLRFPKKGRLPLYQVAESFRPAMASAYKLAQANIAYSRFSFFFKPRYTVFL